MINTSLKTNEFENLQRQLHGDCLSDVVSRGLYATDASVYQMLPRAVVKPRGIDDVATLINFAGERGHPLLPRGAGTSQNGQTVNDAIVIDNSRYLNRLLEFDAERRRCVVEPGMVLDDLNRFLKPHGLWFPVDVSTASRATIGGMTGNNSCGQRSIVYGTMRNNVESLNVLGADGVERHFASWQMQDGGQWHPASQSSWSTAKPVERDFVDALLALGESCRAQVEQHFPKVLRRVGGYNLDALHRGHTGHTGTVADSINLAHLLVGSEGTLGMATAIELKLAPLPGEKVVGVCHFPTFYQAMDAAQHLIKLDPCAVELMDATMLGLAFEIDEFRATCKEFVRGQPEALLLVEFANGSLDNNRSALARLRECMGDLGFSWQGEEKRWGGVIEIENPSLQSAVAEVRKSGLNIMMSMKSEGKPVSFVEDCAVELEDLAEYTQGLTDIFSKYGTRGTWYAHASVGCLHVRPVLNLKLDQDRQTMRAIADEAFDLVKRYKGSHSGEHGDGISRSEFHGKMFGAEVVKAFEELKIRFDPDKLFNPGRIVDAPRMNDRKLLRFHQDYKTSSVPMQLDWSQWPESDHGLQAAVEMCNNNGACRKLAGGAMCPSYRVTRDEQHLTRGRANTLRLALSGQLTNTNADKNILATDELHEAMQLCVSCKACKRECPTGVDMARMKLEVLAARDEQGKTGLHERIVAALPMYAYQLSRVALAPRLINVLQQGFRLPILGDLLERLTGFSKQRRLPSFASTAFNFSVAENLSLPARPDESAAEQGRDTSDGSKADSNLNKNTDKPHVVLFADTFNRYFEPQVLSAALRVLKTAGFKVSSPDAVSERPLCCGRTYLATGQIDKARAEMARSRDGLWAALAADESAVIVGLEPSCVLTFRDELSQVLPGSLSDKLAQRVFLFEEFLAQQLAVGNLEGLKNSLNREIGKATQSSVARAAATDEAKVSNRSGSGALTDNAPVVETSPKESQRKFLLHGHCHQKAFGQMPQLGKILALIADAEISVIDSSCCGMAGAFGYHKDTAEVSVQMAELDLFPAIRSAMEADTQRNTAKDKPQGYGGDAASSRKVQTILVADGTSCRHQIQEGLDLQAVHVAQVLDLAMSGSL